MSHLSLLRSFTHFLTGVCAIIGGVFTGLCSPVASRAALWRRWAEAATAAAAAALTWFLSCSGRADRLPHLPLSQSHPEEDRAGQGFLTPPPGAGRPTGGTAARAGKRAVCRATERQTGFHQGGDPSACLSADVRNSWTLWRFFVFY